MPRRGPPPPCGRRCKRKKSGEGDPPAGAAEEDGGGVDRISQLPEGVLGDIISLLPTKDGARTRILASRWRHIWLSAPLNLDCRDLAAAYNNVPGVVSHILSTHQGPVRRLCVKRYRLPPAATVDAWLQSAALDGLEELEFWLYKYIFLKLAPLPASIYLFSPTLRVATIGGCRLPDDAVAQGRLHFPSLKQLALEYVSISECSLHSLIASCPALECLLMYSSFGCHRLRINSLSLTSICVQTRDPVGLNDLVLQELIIENAPCLEKLIPLYFFRGLRVSVISAPRLNTLGFLTDWNDCSTKLALGSTVIRGLRTDSLLTMAVHTVKILAVNMAFLSLDNTVDMMRLFPCLEKLHVKSGISGEKNLWQRKYRSLITCFDIHLKTVVLEPYRGTWSQVNFAKFFVLNAKVLELMTFHVDANSYNEEFLAEQRRKLQLENKTSRDAQFHFTTGTCLQAVWETKHLCHFNFYDPFVCTC